MSEVEHVERIGWLYLEGASTREKAPSFSEESRKTSLSGPFLFPSLPPFIPSIQIEMRG